MEHKEGEPTALQASPFYFNSTPEVKKQGSGRELLPPPAISSLYSLHLSPVLQGFQDRQRYGLVASVPLLKWQRLAGRPETD